MWLMLGGNALGGGLDLLVGLLLWRLLGSGTCSAGRGGRRVTLGLGVVGFAHQRVLAIPIFERDQYIQVQVREILGGWARVWGR